MMFMCALLVLYLGTSSFSARVQHHDDNPCSATGFFCGNGLCVDANRVCDTIVDCPDASDEATCHNSAHDFNQINPVIRQRRQSKCPKNQWQCRNGDCIGFDGKCDGTVDCADGSDETHALCRKMRCQSNWFRCTYGACVDGTAPCNGIQECADNSDELLPRCRNETDEVRFQFTCANGRKISASSHCDGLDDCGDSSDENVRACAAKQCPAYLFQCAYGACVDSGADCNGVQECADNSDESDELCNRSGTSTVTTTTKKPVITPGGSCVLPPYPEHGRYVVGGVPNAAPGQSFFSFQLNVTCNPGYGVIGNSSVFCIDGSWSVSLPECVRFCRLKKHPSVEYRCILSEELSGVEGARECSNMEPSGSVVKPICRAPNYYYPGVLSFMRCIDGNWDHVAICQPECGRITPAGEQLVIGGRHARRGELPWHAGIYRKTTTPYMQICGGSLISSKVVISAAHCFWTDIDKLLPAAHFAVAVGKLYRPWNNPMDDAQKADVADIKIPPRFQGASTNYQEDIAIVKLTVEFEFKTYVRPVCIDFDVTFDSRQLQDGKLGKVAGWGLTEANGNASQILKVLEMPYVNIERCLDTVPASFREYITSDKICAGYGNGSALCKGDSGGGLVFPESDRGTERFYLRGIVSTAPSNEDVCNAFTLTSFTQILKHEIFIKRHVDLF